MERDNRGNNLIFIISQPRSGSTLLDLMLGRHPDVHTGGETWLMMHPLFGLRTEGVSTEYGAAITRLALGEFLESIPGGSGVYFQGVRRMAAHIFDAALEATGKRYFVDKCPKYYHVLPELFETFPDAHYIFLFRNPLAVLCSIDDIFRKASIFVQYAAVKQDLFRCPELMIEALERPPASTTVVSYEQLVQHPEAEVGRLCDALDLEFHPGMVHYGVGGVQKRLMGDPVGVYRHERPVTDRIDRWKERLTEPRFWRMAHDYLRWLGPGTVAGMGYSYDSLRSTLEDARPTFIRRSLVLPSRVRMAYLGKAFHYWSLRDMISRAAWEVTYREYRRK